MVVGVKLMAGCLWWMYGDGMGVASGGGVVLDGVMVMVREIVAIFFILFLVFIRMRREDGDNLNIFSLEFFMFFLRF